MRISSPGRIWAAVKSVFESYSFASIVKDGAWQKFVGSFHKLWG